MVCYEAKAKLMYLLRYPPEHSLVKEFFAESQGFRQAKLASFTYSDQMIPKGRSQTH